MGQTAIFALAVSYTLQPCSSGGRSVMLVMDRVAFVGTVVLPMTRMVFGTPAFMAI
jgi:hypothetical protein